MNRQPARALQPRPQRKQPAGPHALALAGAGLLTAGLCAVASLAAAPEGQPRPATRPAAQKVAVAVAAAPADSPVVTPTSPLPRTSFKGPTRNQLLADLKRVRPEGPRLIWNPTQLEALLAQADRNPRLKSFRDALLQRARLHLAEPPLPYNPDGTHLRRGSWRISERALDLGVAYRLTGDARYAERLWQELDSLCSFPNWNEDNVKDHLNFGNISAAAAITYDACRDYLTPERRKRAVDALLSRSVDNGLKWYGKNAWWARYDNNWNGVCNGGLGLAALAIIDENDVTRDRCSRLLERIAASLPLMLERLGPDGGGDESVSYLGYGLTNALDFIASLRSVFGTDYGFESFPGLLGAGDFQVYMSGPLGTFNYADAGPAQVDNSRNLLLARLSGSMLVAARHYKLSRIESSARDFLWYVDAPEKPRPAAQDAYFRSVEAVGFHTDLLGDDDIFAGFRAGGTCAHGDNDRGTFFYTAIGRTWAADLGRDSYSLPEYFTTRDDSKRWLLYRKAAQGHNTLVIGPGDHADQIASATAVVRRFQTSDTHGFAVADLTPVYQHARKVHRGVRFDRPDGILTVRDEIELDQPLDVYWQMHVENAEFSQVSPQAMRVFNNGKAILVRITEGPGAFEVMDAKPLPGTPDLPGQAGNPTFKKLVIKLPQTTNATLNVVISPLNAGGSTPPGPPAAPLADWK